MPHTSRNISTGAAPANTLVTIPCDKGYLTSVSLTDLLRDTPPLTVWAEIGISLSTVNLERILTVLCHGDVSFDNSLLWTGRIPVEASMHVFVSLTSLDTGEYHFSISTEIPSQ